MMLACKKVSIVTRDTRKVAIETMVLDQWKTQGGIHSDQVSCVSA